MPFCATCHTWFSTHDERPHRCPPLWLARPHDNEPENARLIYAYTAEDAAIKCLHQHDEWQAEGVTDNAYILVVPATEPDAKPARFRVHGEYTVTYSAEELSDDDEIPEE